jgi:hypothetical protein
MTTSESPWLIPDPRKGITKERAAKAATFIGRAMRAGLTVARTRSRATAGHIRDHGYTVVGFGLFDAAWFTHSLFSGLLVTGISFLAFEWKVSDDDG